MRTRALSSQSTFCSYLEEISNTSDCSEGFYAKNDEPMFTRRKSQRIKTNKAVQNVVTRNVPRSTKRKKAHKTRGQPKKPSTSTLIQQDVKTIAEMFRSTKAQLAHNKQVLKDITFDTSKLLIAINKMDKNFNKAFVSVSEKNTKTPICHSQVCENRPENDDYSFALRHTSDVGENNLYKMYFDTKSLCCFEPLQKFISDSKQTSTEDHLHNGVDINLTQCPSESVLKSITLPNENATNLNTRNEKCLSSIANHLPTDEINKSYTFTLMSQDMFSDTQTTNNDACLTTNTHETHLRLDPLHYSTPLPNLKINSQNVSESAAPIQQLLKKPIKKSPKKRLNNTKKPSKPKKLIANTQYNTNINTIQYDLRQFSTKDDEKVVIHENGTNKNVNGSNREPKKITENFSNIATQEVTCDIIDEKPIELDSDEQSDNEVNTNIQQTQNASFNNSNFGAENNLEYVHSMSQTNNTKESENILYVPSTPTTNVQKKQTINHIEEHMHSKFQMNNMKHFQNGPDFINFKRTFTNNTNVKDRDTQHNSIGEHLTMSQQNVSNNEEFVDLKSKKTFKQYDWLKPVKYVQVVRAVNKKDCNKEQPTVLPKEFWDDPNAEIPKEWLKDFED